MSRKAKNENVKTEMTNEVVNKISETTTSEELPAKVYGQIDANGNEVVTATTELVTTDGVKLSTFRAQYEQVGKSMKELCVMANHLNEFNAKVFKEYVITVMGLSRQSYEMMVKVGNIYECHAEIMPYISHTKTAELLPVREQLDDFADALKVRYKTDDVNRAWEFFGGETQKDIRATVKAYLVGDGADIDESDEETESTESTEDEYEVDTTEQDAIDHYVEYFSSLKVGTELDSDDIKEIAGLIAILKKYDFTRKVTLHKGGENE